MFQFQSQLFSKGDIQKLGKVEFEAVSHGCLSLSAQQIGRCSATFHKKLHRFLKLRMRSLFVLLVKRGQTNLKGSLQQVQLI